MNDHALYDLDPRVAVRTAPPVEAAPAGRLLTGGILVITVATFILYWCTGILLAERRAAGHFGADTGFYAVLADMGVHYRAARFHPVTTVLGLAWMKAFSPLAGLLASATVLKGLFAAVGALGVWAAMSIFRALLPPGYVLLSGILYAGSFGLWYFAAIPESKIVTATLSTLYIAGYVRLRARWSLSGAIVLSIILALACLNEIVSCFLLAIPIVDALLRHKFDWREYRWLAAHVPVVLAAWFVLEVFVNGWLIPESKYPEGQSHFNMLLYYIARNDYSFASLHGFVANWFFFNLIAPTIVAPQWAAQGGYFESSMLAYLASPLPLAALLVLGLMAVASFLSRAKGLGPAGQLMLPIAAYALVRAVFFFIFNPSEPLLFSPAATIAHWLILLVPFAASRLPAKRAVLAVLCVLVLASNAAFMLGPSGWSGLIWRPAAP